MMGSLTLIRMFLRLDEDQHISAESFLLIADLLVPSVHLECHNNSQISCWS